MNEAPIYTEVFLQANEGEDGAFRVHFPDFSGETEGAAGFLRPATFREALTPRLRTATAADGTQTEIEVPRAIYVAIEHELEYPYAAWDCEEIKGDNTLATRLGFEPRLPRKFCQAAIVATPQMALV